MTVQLQKNLDRIRIRRVAFMREEENTKPPPPPPQKVESSPEPEPEPVPRVDLGNRTSGLFGGLPGQLPARSRQVREKSATPASQVDESESSYEYYDETDEEDDEEIEEEDGSR